MTSTCTIPNSSLFTAITRWVMLPFFALFFAFSTVSISTSTPAEAGLGKKVKVVGKVFKKVEKAGRKLSKKKGVAGKIGKALQKGGRAGRKGTKFVRNGLKKANGAVNKQLAKSRVGRGIQKGVKTYKKVRKNAVSKAFRRCQSDLCNDARDVADAAIPG